MNALRIAKRIIIQLKNDKRTLALLLVAPLVVLTLLSIIFNYSDSNQDIKIGYYNIEKKLVTKIKDDAEVISFDNKKNIDKKLEDKNLAAFIFQKNDNYYIKYNDGNYTNSTQAKGILLGAISEYQLNIIKNVIDDLQETISDIVPNFEKKEQKEIEIVEQYLYLDEDANIFDSINPVLINFFVFFFVYIISGVSLLSEKKSQTLERLLTYPVKRSQIVFGYVLGYGSISIIQTLLIVFYSIKILDIVSVGSISLIVFINVLTALIALSFGILLSSLAKSEFQVIQFVPLLIVPQIFFSNILPVENMSEGLQTFAHFLPLYYSATALQDIMIKGASFNDIYLNIFILIGFIFVLIIATILMLKKYRKI